MKVALNYCFATQTDYDGHQGREIAQKNQNKTNLMKIWMTKTGESVMMNPKKRAGIALNRSGN
jgi:hypothetical protein